MPEVPETPNSPPPTISTESPPTPPTESITGNESILDEKKEEVEFVPVSRDDIKLPEGLTVDDAQMESFVSLVNDREMSGADRAAALIDLYTKSVQAASEANSVAWDTVQKEWQDKVRADPEIGGEKLSGVLVNVGKLLEEFGNAEVKEVLNFTGAGNHPAMVKFFNNMASKLVETSKPAPGNPPSAAGTLEDRARRMFPSAN